MPVTIETYNAAPIVVDGDDMVVDGQVLPIRQKLIFAGLEVNEDPQDYNDGNFYGANQGSSVLVKIRVQAFKKNPDGTYGSRWKAGMDYDYRMIANNTTWVDSTTGEVLGLVGEEEIEANTQEALYDGQGVLVEPAGKFNGRTIIKENEFFERMSELAPIVVRDLVRAYMNNNKSRVQPYAKF